VKDLSVLTGNDGVSVVVEGTAEYLVRVTFEDLFALSSLRVPQSRRVVNACRQDLRALRVETYLWTTVQTYIQFQKDESNAACWRHCVLIKQ